jgi:hypothetical protein
MAQIWSVGLKCSVAAVVMASAPAIVLIRMTAMLQIFFCSVSHIDYGNIEIQCYSGQRVISIQCNAVFLDLVHCGYPGTILMS